MLFAESFFRAKNQMTAYYFMRTEDSQALYFKHARSPKRITTFHEGFAITRNQHGPKTPCSTERILAAGLARGIGGEVTDFKSPVITTIEFRS
jgi:hypothetical protein